MSILRKIINFARKNIVSEMKKIMITFLLALVSTIGWGQTKNETVWNEVVSGYANTPYVKVTKVGMYADRMEMTLHIDFVKGQWISIAPNTVVKADGKDYTVKTATVIKLGEHYTLPEDTLNFVLTFEPVPLTMKKFDLVEPGGWQVMNIRNADLLPEGIVDTYWRDDATGDWFIGFASKHVIYNNKVLDIVSQTEKRGAYTLTLDNGTTIKVGKMKKGTRAISIDRNNPVVCSIITTSALPDYPMKDTRKGFVDNGFNPTDSVTIIGWLKDMPEQEWNKSKEFVVALENIISNKEENAYSKMDSLGRFSFKMPLINSSEVFIDWGRSTVNAFLEPGKTYFFLYDFVTGQKLWMGDNVRVQNELLAHPRSRSEARVPYDTQDADLMAYWAKADSARLVQEEHLKSLQLSHPTLSQRYIDYIGDYYRMLQGRNMMQARYCVEDRSVPQEYMDYVGRKFWKKAPKPYTLYRDFTTMNNDFLSQIIMGRNEDIDVVMKRLEKEGSVSMTDEERKALDDFPAFAKKVQADIEKAKNDDEVKSIVEKYNSSELVTKLNALLGRYENVLSTYGFRQVLDVVDSVGCDRSLRDIVLAQRICQQIDATRQPVSPAIMEFAEQQIKTPAVYDVIKSLNDKYLAIQQRDISKSSSLKSAEDVANMSDGEKILRKIIEPYKGKLILLDIWGVWCSPCKEALSHSAEEYERLKDFDIVYLYLANRSDDNSWKNIIKEYNIVGDNVVHYNLPADQQSAVEHFLKVTGFPTYKLIDRDGTILDVNADPRSLESLARLLEQMK